MVHLHAQHSRTSPWSALSALSTAVLGVLALSACGGGGSSSTASVNTLTAQPSFHLAPLQLNEPSSASDLASIANQAIPAGMETLPSARLLPQTITAALANRAREAAQSATPEAATAQVVTYTPAQIRAAYKLVAATNVLPSTSAARAALGAGQTIYLIDTFNDPNVLSDLNAYSEKFGLPTCSSVTIAVNTKRPLSSAATTGCTFSVVYTGTAGGLNASAPAYNAGWAPEIALDVENAHAIAPMARIILIEAAGSGLPALLGAITAANNMGPGVVSMSFGSTEGAWVTSYDSYFTTKGMSYFAATGDSGAGVNWPAVSPHVVAVGGTTLSISTSSAGTTRSEIGWSDGGGGVSAYEPVPSWQAALSKTYKTRRVADVSMNADPNTGQYLGLTPPGGSIAWYSAGGTSLSTPMWAALTAVANAQRVLAGSDTLSNVQTVIYQTVLPVASSYSADFLDVTKGADGSCATCVASVGYDTITGLGTPNANSLLTALVAAKQ